MKKDSVEKQVDDYLSGKIPYIDLRQDNPPVISAKDVVARTTTVDELVVNKKTTKG